VATACLKWIALLAFASVTNHQKERIAMIRKLKSGKFRIYSRKKNPDTGKRRNLGTFETREAAQQHEREIQYFKKH
jgi:cell division septation protein DedD